MLRSVEIYHPTLTFNVSLPNLPIGLSEISGYWNDGIITVCGNRHPKSQTFICYQLNLPTMEWVEYLDPVYYLKTWGTSSIRPPKEWSIFAIGGHGGRYDRSSRIFDPLTLALHEDDTAFSQGLYDWPCIFNAHNETVHVIGQESIFQFSNGSWSEVENL